MAKGKKIFHFPLGDEGQWRRISEFQSSMVSRFNL